MPKQLRILSDDGLQYTLAVLIRHALADWRTAKLLGETEKANAYAYSVVEFAKAFGDLTSVKQDDRDV